MALRKFLFMNQTEGFSEEFTSGGADQLDMGSSRIVNVADPTAAQDAATKAYVDSVATGLDVKQSVRVSPTADFSTYVGAGSGVGATLTSPDDNVSHNTQDGVALVVGNRVLVATAGGNTTTPDEENGIYVVTTLADGAGQELVLTRATDFDQNAEVTAGAFTFVTEGTTNADTGWVLVTNDPITVDTTPLQFTQFSSTTAYTFDQGLSNTSGSIKVELDTDADLQSAGAGGGSSGLEFDVNTAAGQLRVAVSATGSINRLADGIGLELDPTANTAGNNFSLSSSATGLTVLRAPKTEANYIANEAIAVGDPVAWAAGVNDKLAKGRADTDAKSRIVGIARTAATALDDTLAIVSEGPAVGVIAGATAGDPYYLQDTGGVGTFASITAGKRVIRLGFAKNATDLFVDIMDLGKKAA
jgi:hypothetical protein